MTQPSELPEGAFSPHAWGLPCTVNNLFNLTQGSWLPASTLLPDLITLQELTLTKGLPVFSQGRRAGGPFPVVFTPLPSRGWMASPLDWE